MKKSAIKEMFFGNRGAYNKIETTTEYRRLLGEAVKNENEIREKLAISPELLKLYEKTNDSIEAMHFESADMFFIEGFKFGLLMGIECGEE